MTSVMGATASSQLPIASAAASEPAIGKEFNSFIKLLIAQMRNQDPLAPIVFEPSWPNGCWRSQPSAAAIRALFPISAWPSSGRW